MPCALPPAQLTALLPAQLTALPPTQLTALLPAQFVALPPAQLTALLPVQFVALLPSYVDAEVISECHFCPKCCTTFCPRVRKAPSALTPASSE